MPRILQTRNREAAARVLAKKYDRVFIRNKNITWNPLRMRRVKISDLAPFIVMSQPEFDAQLEAWNRDGGMVIYDRTYTQYENVAAHQAQLVCECPASITELEAWTEGASEVAVVFRPPNWKEHYRYVRNTRPEAALCRRLYDLVAAAPTHPGLRDALELRDGLRVLPEAPTAEALGLTTAQLRHVRKALFPPWAFRGVWQVVPRTPPHDATLAGVYHWIVNECPKVDGAHICNGMNMMKHVRFWKLAIRALDRCGAVGVRDTLYYYYLDRVNPHWDRLDARRRVAEGRLAQVIKKIEQAAELTLPAVHSPQSAFLPRRAPPPSSVLALP